MIQRLRAEYEKYLGQHDLKPRKLPSRRDREAGQREVVRIMYEEARSRGDPMAEGILISYEKKRDHYLAETRHPATIQIEKAAEEVEAAIRALPAFAAKFHDEVFVGEFPTGSINCQTVKVDGGLLVLVNSGTLMMLQQVVTFLWRGDADHPGSQASLDAADGVAEVLASYIKHGDPYYGPKPLSGGMLATASSLMSAAAMKFVVAHEYGHILAGHLAEPSVESMAIDTKVGAIEVLRKDHVQEFEADEIGYSLTLGVTANEEFDLAVIDVKNFDDLDAIHAALMQKCLIAAPFVTLMVDDILGRFSEAARLVGNKPVSRETHPPAADRIERLLARLPSPNPRYSGFINLPFMLLPSIERIVGVMTDRIFRQPQTAAVNDDDHGRDTAQGDWLEDIMGCVDAIRSRDWSAATLILTDAFEKQRTIFELDVDVVRRELVRTALGRKTDIRRTLQDRHRDRRAIEQHLEVANSDPLSRYAGPLLGPQRHSSAVLADLVSDEKPNGLDLVKTVLEEEAARPDGLPGKVHLLDAVLSAWRGERKRALSSFESALSGGIADPDGLMTRFVELERSALKLDVQLDIQALLVAVAQKALADSGAARELAGLVKAYTEYLGVPLSPVAQRMIDVQMQREE